MYNQLCSIFNNDIDKETKGNGTGGGQEEKLLAHGALTTIISSYSWE